MRSMRDGFTLTTVHFALGAIAMAGITACSSSLSASSIAPTTSQASSSHVRANTTQCPSSVVYVDSSQRGSVVVYDRRDLHANPCGEIIGVTEPEGLFVDSKGNLWVADAGAKQVYKFKPGNTTPSVTLDDPNGVPNAVTVDEKSGTVYVVEYQNNSDATTLVEIYAAGSTTPTGTLHDPEARNGGYVAVDSQGNVYASFMTQSNKGQVDRWMGGSGQPENLGLRIVSDGAIVTTHSGALGICDPYWYRCGIYERGSTKISHIFGHMGWPHHQHSKRIVPNKEWWLVPFGLALDRGEHNAYVTSESLSHWRFPGPLRRPNHRPDVEIEVPGVAGNGVAVYPASRPGAPY
jgi:hypothetical protein